MNIKITILLIIALLSVSTSPIIAKSLVDVPAVSISFWRMIIGSFFLWFYSGFFKLFWYFCFTRGRIVIWNSSGSL